MVAGWSWGGGLPVSGFGLPPLRTRQRWTRSRFLEAALVLGWSRNYMNTDGPVQARLCPHNAGQRLVAASEADRAS